MRSIRLILIAGALAALALIFMVRARAQSANFTAAGFAGTYAFHMTPVKSFSSDNGTASGLATAPYQDILRVGVLTATPDGSSFPAHGSLSGNTIATIDNDAGSTRVAVFSWTGHYGVNANGTGVFTVEALAPSTTVTCFDSADNSVAAPATAPPYPPPPLAGTAPSGQTCDFGLSTSVEGPESYAFVIVRSTNHIEFVETDNGPGGGGAKIFLAGAATRQGQGEN